MAFFIFIIVVYALFYLLFRKYPKKTVDIVHTVIAKRCLHIILKILFYIIIITCIIMFSNSLGANELPSHMSAILVAEGLVTLCSTTNTEGHLIMMSSFGGNSNSNPGSIGGTAGSNGGGGGPSRPGPSGNSSGNRTLNTTSVTEEVRRAQDSRMSLGGLLNPVFNCTRVTGRYVVGGKYTGTMVMTTTYTPGSLSDTLANGCKAVYRRREADARIGNKKNITLSDISAGIPTRQGIHDFARTYGGNEPAVRIFADKVNNHEPWSRITIFSPLSSRSGTGAHAPKFTILDAMRDAGF